MPDEELDPTIGTPALEAGEGGESSLPSVSAGATEPVPSDASGGETPAEAALVPSHRLREEADARRQAEERLGQYEPWSPALERLQQFGLTPEQVVTLLDQSTAPPTATPATSDPAAAFEQWAEKELGQSTWEMTDTEKKLANRQFLTEQRWQQAEATREATERQSFEQRATAELKAVAAKHPLFAGQYLSATLYDAWIQAGGKVSMDQIAQKLLGEIEPHTRQTVANYAANKERDARTPIPAAGGGAPSPVAEVPLHTLSREDRAKAVEEFLRTNQAA